ncbi:hypothetical protein Aperf_G00000086071 [Anoplocephala perfoliata]
MYRKLAVEELRKPGAILENPVKIATAVKEFLSPHFSSRNVYDILLCYLSILEYQLRKMVLRVRDIMESVVMETILQNYDRTKTLNFFDSGKTYEAVKWQSLLIQSARWRQTIYEFAQQPRNEDCVLLSLAMPLIAENFIDELASVPMAWGTLEIYLNCDMGCHSEATYLLLQSVLQCLIRRRIDNAARHLSWLLESEARRRGCDVSRYSVYFCYAKNYPNEVMAMCNILSEQALSSSELETAGQAYSSSYRGRGAVYHADSYAMPRFEGDRRLTRIQIYSTCMGDAPPPASLIRQPSFIERLLTEKQECYAYLYTYASVIVEEIDLSTE